MFLCIFNRHDPADLLQPQIVFTSILFQLRKFIIRVQQKKENNKKEIKKVRDGCWAGPGLMVEMD